MWGTWNEWWKVHNRVKNRVNFIQTSWPVTYIREISHLVFIFLCRHSQILDGRETRKKVQEDTDLDSTLTNPHNMPHTYQEWGGAHQSGRSRLSGIQDEM